MNTLGQVGPIELKRGASSLELHTTAGVITLSRGQLVRLHDLLSQAGDAMVIPEMEPKNDCNCMESCPCCGFEP